MSYEKIHTQTYIYVSVCDSATPPGIRGTCQVQSRGIYVTLPVSLTPSPYIYTRVCVCVCVCRAAVDPTATLIFDNLF